MNNEYNHTCRSCDHSPACRKQVVVDGEKVPAREQEVIRMTCLCVVEDICRDCLHFAGKRCAAWRVRYGKRRPQRLIRCPKRVVL
jgi:hypothetical protein